MPTARSRRTSSFRVQSYREERALRTLSCRRLRCPFRDDQHDFLELLERQAAAMNEPDDEKEAGPSEDELGAEILENEPESNTSKEEVSSEVLKAPAKEENTVPSGDVINRPSPVDAPSNEISRLLPAQNPKNADMPGLRLIA